MTLTGANGMPRPIRGHQNNQGFSSNFQRVDANEPGPSDLAQSFGQLSVNQGSLKLDL